jgi:hypothetical protein
MKFQGLSTLRLRFEQILLTCSGLTLGGASFAHHERRGGAAEWAKLKKPKLFDKRGIP